MWVYVVQASVVRLANQLLFLPDFSASVEGLPGGVQWLNAPPWTLVDGPAEERQRCQREGQADPLCQENGTDCGVFAMYTLKALWLGWEVGLLQVRTTSWCHIASSVERASSSLPQVNKKYVRDELACDLICGATFQRVKFEE